MGNMAQVDKQKDLSLGPEKMNAQATDEQLYYAKILDIGMKVGLSGIIVTFIMYVSGAMNPKIPLTDVSKYWGMKSHDYLVTANIKGGWSWLNMYGFGDFINFFPIALLAGVTVICYLAIIPTLLRKKDTVYAAIALLEVLVLAAAASGLISTGGH